MEPLTSCFATRPSQRRQRRPLEEQHNLGSLPRLLNQEPFNYLEAQLPPDSHLCHRVPCAASPSSHSLNPSLSNSRDLATTLQEADGAGSGSVDAVADRVQHRAAEEGGGPGFGLPGQRSGRGASVFSRRTRRRHREARTGRKAARGEPGPAETDNADSTSSSRGTGASCRPDSAGSACCRDASDAALAHSADS